ncbi:MAG: isoprenylcysteine carboxylmethyltransferase family protein [Anaerolineae bacterium]|nr:isoprenylcysteine carboxylmethyltransferase family protein [Anaerolineae bacterium]
MTDLYDKTELTRLIRVRIIQLSVQLTVIGAALFISAGTIRWTMAWVYLALSLLILATNGYLLLRYNPGIVAERAQRKADTKPWDKVITLLYAIAMFAMQIVAGLDKRFSWSKPLPGWVLPIALILFVLGNALANWAMTTNAYFSTTVRIQNERGHRVCSSGPYRFIRHPGYSGWILSWIGTPLLLGTLWALVASLAATLIMIVRTMLEDRTLQNELPGYAGYARQTRYRLVPGIW